MWAHDSAVGVVTGSHLAVGDCHMDIANGIALFTQR